MRRADSILIALVLSVLVSSAAVASGDRINIANLGSCVDGRPWDVYVLGADSATDCDPALPNGTAEAHCRCMDGVVAALTSGSGSGAPTTLDYFVGTTTASLSAERVGTDTATIDVDLGTPGQVKFNAIGLSCTDCLTLTQIDESTLPASGLTHPQIMARLAVGGGY